jgi:hypothetical protein
MSNWRTVANPNWAGRQPTPLAGSECHDGTHFVTVQCSCGEQMHMHQSQWNVAQGQGIASRCHGCSEVLLFEPGFFDKALSDMREQGWIA